MACPRAQARIIESLLASLMITTTLILVNPYFLNTSLIKEENYKEDLASKILSFMLYNNILGRAYHGDYSLITETLEKTIPLKYGFKIAIYDENWSLKWSFERNFNERNSRSAQIILNGNGKAYTYILIFVLAIS